MNKTACIVINNDNKFEAVYYEGNNRPLNCILVTPDGSTSRNDYLLINTGVEVSWRDHFNPRRYKVLTVVFNGVVLFEKVTGNSHQLVIDVLNKYNDMIPSQLEIIALESQEKEKSELELAIEDLKSERATLQEQIKIYKEIQTKKEEIKALLDKLNE